MKRITAFTLILVTLALLLGGCMDQGNINHVHKTIGESEIYTEADIENAMDVVTQFFRREFGGCTLVHLYYDEEDCAARGKAWAMHYKADEGILLLSTFDVGSDGGDGSLNPDSTYEGWQWILTRSKGGSWTLQTWGYG